MKGDAEVAGENADAESADSPTSLHRAARGTVLNLAGSVVSSLATFGLTVAVTRLVTQADAGVFFSATSLFLLATSLGQLGTNTGLVYFLSRARARGQLSRASQYMRTAGVPVFVVAVLMAFAVFAMAERLGSILSPGEEAQFAHYVRIMAFFIPAAAVANLVLAATRGLGTMKVNAALDQMARPVLQLIMVGFALALIGPRSVPWMWSAAYLVVAAVGWMWWRKLRDRAAVQVSEPGRAFGRKFWSFSAPRALAGVTQVAMQRLDIILVGALAGLSAAAVYAAATRFLALGQMAARAISLSAQPLLGESLARRDHEDSKRLYQVSTAWIVLISWPLYLILIVFGKRILDIFGEGYSIAGVVLLVLCSTMLIATACGMVDMILIMAGKPGWNLAHVLFAFVINLALDLILIPSIGMLGAAIGWAAAILVGNVLPLAQVAYWFKLHPFSKATILAMAISTVAFAVLPLTLRFVWGDGMLPLIVSLVAGLVAFTLLLMRWHGMLQIGVLMRSMRAQNRRR